MHSKHRTIKSFIVEFAAILLNQFSIRFQDLIFVGFSMKLIHDLDADAVHSTAEMLKNVEAIEYDFGIEEYYIYNCSEK